MPGTSGRSAHVSADALSLRFADGRELFDGLTLGVGDERIGLVGPNGCGKSTLLRLLTGELSPTAGSVVRRGPVGYLAQLNRFAPGTSVADALGIGPKLRAITRVLDGTAAPTDLDTIGDDWNARERAALTLVEVGLPGLPVDRPADVVSGGEATRLALAALLMDRPRVLMLDEPTNDLDRESRTALYAVVATWPHGLVVATHDRELLHRMDRIVELRDGKARSYGGGYLAYRLEVDREHAAAMRDHDNAAAALKRTEASLQKTRERKARSDARGRRSRSTGSQPPLVLNAARERSQATSARLQEKGERLREAARDRAKAARERLDAREPLHMPVARSGLAAGTTVVSLRDVAVGHDGTDVLAGISLDIVGPVRMAMTGPNGSGKTTLLQVIAGHQAPARGDLRRGVAPGRMAFLDQRCALLGTRGTVLDAFVAHHPGADVTTVRQTLAHFRFRADAALQPVGTLSGGERMRAALACVLSGPEPPCCLVLDEPTNHLDLDSLEQLEAALRAYDGAIVMASHDETFLDAAGVTVRVPVEQWRMR